MAATLDETRLAKLTIETFKSLTFDKPDHTYRVLFNPSEYSRTCSANYKTTQAKGTSKPSISHASGNPDQLSLSLFFDGTGVVGEPGPVADEVNGFLDLMRYRGDEHKPRYLWLSWGPLGFRGVLKSATASFTLFDRDGRPIRAKVSAAFEEAVEDRERVREERNSSPDLHRVWRVEEGQSLDAIAHEFYGDAGRWRELAAFNSLENPRRLEPGALLALPPEEA